MLNICRDDISNALVQIPSAWSREQLVQFAAQELAARYDKCSEEDLIAELINAVIELTTHVAGPGEN